VKSKLKKGSLIVFDKGANTKDNIELIEGDELKYLTAMKLNESHDKIIAAFDKDDKDNVELVDPKKGIYGIKIVKPSSIKYFYFSELLQKRQLESKARAVMRKLEEAKEIQKAITNKKDLPKKFRVNNELIEINYSFTTKLEEMSEEEAIEFLKSTLITGREGFFCLKSNKNLTLTVNFLKNGVKQYIFANFDKINSLIVTRMSEIS